MECEYQDKNEQNNTNENSGFLDLPPQLISEIFNHLGATDLALVSCVCTLFFKLSSDCHGWKDFYCNRWKLPPPRAPHKAWRELYIDREARSRAFMGCYQTDFLRGHMQGVKTVRIVASLNLIFTAGYDRVLRVWDLEEALPVASSSPLNCTVQAMEADVGLLVVGGSEAPIRCWRAVEGIKHAFDVCDDGCEICLWGHSGPVTCLGLDGGRIFSGSWDMSIRVWDRGSMQCLKVLKHMDWVWALAATGSKVFSTSGSDLYSWDVESGERLRVRFGIHVGQAYSLQCDQSGRFLFTGGEDGAVHIFDESSDIGGGHKSLTSWAPHFGPVYALGFDDPWLVSASGDGRLAMMDFRKQLKAYSESKSQVRVNNNLQLQHRRINKLQNMPDHKLLNVVQPQRMLYGFYKNLYSVDIGAERIIAGGEEKIVRIWDFSQALEIEKRVQASRTICFENRARKKKGQDTVVHNGKQVDPCTILANRNDVNFSRS